ncbi:Putative ribonuclease H protein, partial [Glycine soja]
HRHISFGGRVTLINAVLTTIPIYFFSFFRVPSKIIAKLKAIQRRFLWGGGQDQRKIAWVDWKTVCLPKDKGELGIKDLRTFNTALLGKWRWDIFHKQEELWAKIIYSKYGGWRTLEEGRSGCQDSLWWKDLVNLQQQQQNNVIKINTFWKVGQGDKFRFWEDRWIADELPLMEKYPRLYQISCQQKQTIMQMGSNKNTGWEWRRSLFDCEVAMPNAFIGDISQQQIHSHTVDTWMWKPDPRGYYSTKSGYDMIWGGLMEANQNSDFVDLWSLKIPAKAAVFAWRLIRDRLPTKLNLRRRQVMVNDMLCPFCRNKEEEAAHLFFSCSKILPLWWESLSWVNIATTMPQNPRDHYMQHGIRAAEGKKYTRWKCWWIALTWTIWQHRNKIIFQNATFDENKMLDDAVLLIWTWIKTMEKDFATHFNQWSSNIKD